LEDVAGWPWQKRLTYQQSLQEQARLEQQAIEEQSSADTGSVDAPNLGGTHRRARDVPGRTSTPSVETHDEVIST
jgi:hypothetical protein